MNIVRSVEFSNPNFLQAQPDLLCLIRRQKSRADGGSTETALDLPSLITDLAAIRKHQTAISADLKDLQTSNHALWQEAIQSRERHSRQQETINKILRFLATVFGGQVVGDDTGSSAAREGSNVVVDAGREQSQQNKGKEKADDGGRVLVPKIRSRLLLEDVKGRQAARQRERQKLDQSASPEEQEEIQSIGRDEDEEDIEEIPLLREELEDLPTISSGECVQGLRDSFVTLNMLHISHCSFDLFRSRTAVVAVHSIQRGPVSCRYPFTSKV